jgi:hypothetical protein
MSDAWQPAFIARTADTILENQVASIDPNFDAVSREGNYAMSGPYNGRNDAFG